MFWPDCWPPETGQKKEEVAPTGGQLQVQHQNQNSVSESDLTRNPHWTAIFMSSQYGALAINTIIGQINWQMQSAIINNPVGEKSNNTSDKSV